MLNFNTQPYYDDFNEDKNFHRILFKPGVAVQARELTQAQSILQDQIGKFGKFVLSDGSNVSGGKYSLDTNAKSLDLRNVGSIATDIAFFTGMFVVGQNSRCVSLITSADILNYYIVVKSVINGVYNYQSGENLLIFATKDLAYAYLNNSAITPDYTAALNDDISTIIRNCFGQINSTQFTIPSSTIDVGDIITAEIDNYSINYVVTEVGFNSLFSVDKQLHIDYNNVALKITKFASRVVMEVNVNSGVYFTNNTFVKALPQTIVPNSKTQFPSTIIGFEVIETIVDYIDDTSLLEPAQGSYNYTAPGADRYKIYLNLVSKPLINGTLDQTSLTTSKFIELIRIKNGIVVSDNTDPVLGGLQDVLAKQMYDHAGNFIVSPFNITFNNSDFDDDETKLNCSISSGKAYVFGYPFNATFPTNISINKARDTAYSNTQITNTYYGNRIRISDASGFLPNPAVGAKVGLYSGSKLNADGTTLLGFAYVRNIDYVTDNEFGLYLYNANISQKNMMKVKSVVAIGSNGFSANTILDSTGVNVVKDPTFDKLLFKVPYTNVAGINNVQATLDLFVTKTISSNTTTINSGSSNIQFPVGYSASLSNEDKNQNFIIVAKDTNSTYTAGKYINLEEVNIEIKSVTNGNQAVITFLNGYTGQVDIKYSLTYLSATKKIKTLHSDQVVKINATTYPTSIGFADIVAFKGIFKTNTPSTKFDGIWDSGVAYDSSSVVKYGNKLYVSTSINNISNAPNNSSSDWKTLQDVTSRYKTNNGQTEYIYDFGTVTARTQEAAGTVYVLFDYYSHSSDGEYIAFNSYPVPYHEIPKVNINNTLYSLTDYIDFRPRRKNSENTENITYDVYKIPSSTTDSNLRYSMSYYLGRIDKLILTKDRKLSWLTGVSSYKNYTPPKDLTDAMTIATVQFDPYSPNLQSIKIKYAKHRRYTMDDIGELDTRLQNVEYYTALNLVEKTTLSTNIVDSNGVRLKNGFIVDPFTDFTIVDLTTNNKNISLDLENNEARPSFTTRKFNIDASFDVNETGLINKHNLIAFNYTESPLVVQNQATGTIKINQFDAISYEGDLYLEPQSDVWVEEAAPAINNIDDNTAAIMNASEVPGLLYNDWNAYYSSHAYVVEKNNTAVSVNYNNTNYSIKTALVTTKSTQLQILSQNIIPKSRSIQIKFRAIGLAPLTRMFAYINGHLVNAYITPDENPLGIITALNVQNSGNGYSTGVTASISKAGTPSAECIVNISSGAVDSILLTNNGRGYSQSERIFVTLNGANTNNAIISASTVPHQAMNLIANKSGECSGILMLPNSLISFDVGELVLTVCDTPHCDLQNSIAKSQATFYTKTSYYQTITDSIRLPYISKDTGTITQALPSQIPTIIVPASTDYLVHDYSKTYDSIKAGTITVPVYLGMVPMSDVVVSVLLDASEDISSNSSISVNYPTLTFTPYDWSIPQNITLTYNLGTRVEFSNGNFIDNNLPTHIEFYATSGDKRYDYGGTAIPLRSWLSKSPIKAVTSTHLVPYKKFDPDVGPAAAEASFVNLSPIITSNVGGQSFTTVSYGGGDDIGWWTDSTTTYPLTFTATVANTNCAVVSHSIYEEYEFSDHINGSIRTILKSDQQRLQFNYWLYGIAKGNTTLTVSATSANPNWNGIQTTIPVVVGDYLLTPDPQIVVHPNAEIKASSGVVLNSPRVTSSAGGTQVICLSLSTIPTAPVSVTASSSLLAGGGTIYQVSEDGLTLLAGNSVTFTPTTWDQMKTIVVKGSTNPTLYHPETVNYNVTLTASSIDPDFAGKTTIVPMKNNDAGTTPPIVIVPSFDVVRPTMYTTSVDEGTSIEYTLSTSNMVNGKAVWWKINHISTSVNDFLTDRGSLSIYNNFSKFTLNPKADFLTEGPETFTVSIMEFDGSPSILTSGAVTVNDTSTTVQIPVPSYDDIHPSMYISTTNEDEFVEYTVTTTNVANGTLLYWKIDNITTTNSDFLSYAGSLTIYNNVGTFSVRVIGDNTTEGAETFTVSVSTTNGGSAVLTSIEHTINDTSVTATPVPSYDDITSASSVNEGSSITFTVTTTNVVNGTPLFWRISNGTTSNQDFTSTSGSFSINGNTGTFTVSAVADHSTEGTENFTVIVSKASGGIAVLTSSTIEINDTSLTVVPSYDSITSASNVNEGLSLTFTVNTSDVINGTTLYWKINHGTTSSADFGDSSGSFVVTNDVGSFSIYAIADYLTEGAQTCTVSVSTTNGGTAVLTSGTITVNDTSLTAAPVVTYNALYTTTYASTVNEGLIIQYTAKTSNVPYETLLHWRINHKTTSSADFTTNYGVFFIRGDEGTFSIYPIPDLSTEGPEICNVIVSEYYNGPAVLTSADLTVIDTSTTVTPVPTVDSIRTLNYETSVNEDSSLAFIVNTGNVVDNTTLYWKINHGTTAAGDFLYSSGNFTVIGNSGTFTIYALADFTTEGAQTFTVSVSFTDGGVAAKTTGSITVNDTSLTVTPPTYAIAAVVNAVDEGSSIVFNITTTNLSAGTTLFWKYDFKTTNISDFTTADNGTVTIGSDGKGTITILTVADKVKEGAETFNLILSSTKGGLQLATSPVSPTINDTSIPDVIIVPPYVYPEVRFINPIDNHTRNNAAGVKDATFYVTLTAAPKSGETVTVAMTSSDTTKGGIVKSPSSVTFTSANWSSQQSLVMQGISLSGADDIAVPYNAVWTAKTTGSTDAKRLNTSGKYALINDKYKYTTSVLAYTDSVSEYTAKVNGSTATSWTPTLGYSGETATVVAGRGTLDGITLWDGGNDGKMGYVVLKIAVTLKAIYWGTDDSGNYKPATFTVTGFLDPSGDTVTATASGASVLSAKSTATTLNYGYKGSINPTVTSTCSSSVVVQPSTTSRGRIKFTATVSETTKKYSGQGAPGGIGPDMPIEIMLKVSGFHFDYTRASISVAEYITATTTSITVRTDTYEQLGAPVVSTTKSTNPVAIDTNARSRAAVKACLTGYPMPTGSSFTADITQANSAKNNYYIGIYTGIVTNLETFISAIKAKNPAPGSAGEKTLKQEQALLSKYTTLLNSYKHI